MICYKKSNDQGNNGIPQVRSSESRDGCGERATATPAFRRSLLVMTPAESQPKPPTSASPNTTQHPDIPPSHPKQSSHILRNQHTHTMASRALSMPARRLVTSISSTPALSRRSFQSSARMLEVPAGVMPVRKPVGAFRGGYDILLYPPLTLFYLATSLPCDFPTFRLLSLSPLSIFDFALSRDTYTDWMLH
jgi:hypothetical protein